MSPVLLRPFFLSFKNRLIGKSGGSKSRLHDLVILLITLLLISSIYNGTHGFLISLMGQPTYKPMIPERMISLTLLMSIVLLMFSNIIACVGYFYNARDLHFILVTPVSWFQLFMSRLIISISNSSWIVLIFGIPALFGIKNALELDYSFILVAIIASLPILIIPAAVSSLFATIFVNVFPLNRMRELVAFLTMSIAVVGMYVIQKSKPTLTLEQKVEDNSMLMALSHPVDPHPMWLPSRWASEIIFHHMRGDSGWPVNEIIMLSAALLLSILLAFFAFKHWFMRGWTLSLKGAKSGRMHRGVFANFISKLLFPFNPQLRCLLVKEFNMFVRDTTQSVQLILLLMLTFLYLYNFQGLQAIPVGNNETHAWWQTVLCIANIALGGCVLAAISTRFVFPSVSLEGQAYWIMRSAPMSLKQFLYNKFFIWLIPMGGVAVTLLVAGAFAINVSPAAIFLSGVVGLATAIGVVGLAIGIGSVYAKFDWETPSQVAASFGSLVFMVLAVVLVMITLAPASLLIILSTVPGIVLKMTQTDYLGILAGASFLALSINLIAARWAISAGYQALKAREA